MNPGSRTQIRDPEVLASRQDDLALCRRIQDGDEDAFVRLVARHHTDLLRLAQTWIHDGPRAGKALHETWIAALGQLHEIEGRSSFKSWLCGILIDKARGLQRRQGLQVNDPSLAGDHTPAVPSDRFNPAGHRWDGHWQTPPTAWPEMPAESALSTEMRGLLDKAIARLPESQRAVLLLRDVEGLSGEEVRTLLGFDDAHQRQLLHQARARLRALLERHFCPPESTREELP